MPRTRSTCRSTSATATGGRTWRTPCGSARRRVSRVARVLHLGVQLVLGLPPVPRGHLPRAGGCRARRAGGREARARSTTTPASSRRTPTGSGRVRRGSRRAPRRRLRSSSPRTASRPRWRSAAGTPTSWPRPRALVAEAVGSTGYARLPEPQRTAPVPGSSPTCATICASSPREGVTDVVISPVGFVSDHLEVLFDLDHEASSSAGSSASASRGPAPPARIRVRLDDSRADPGADRGRCREARGRTVRPNPEICAPGCCACPVPAGPVRGMPALRPASGWFRRSPAGGADSPLNGPVMSLVIPPP